MPLPRHPRSLLAVFAVMACLLAPCTGSALAAAGGGASVSESAPANAAGGASTTTPTPSRTVTQATGGSSVRAARLGSRALARGAKGTAVRVLQSRLTRAGFPTPVAGIFGPQTEQNVKAFQRAQQLPADGVVTKRVATALKRAVRSRAAAPQPTEQPDLPPPSTSPATLLPDGTAVAPADAPEAVKAVVAAANLIATVPYRWGGGHRHWEDTGYDCSGSVGFALHGAGLLEFSATSGELMTYGAEGAGRWITIYANADHVYMTLGGLRYDTSGAHPSRWQTEPRTTLGYAVRHPVGY